MRIIVGNQSKHEKSELLYEIFGGHHLEPIKNFIHFESFIRSTTFLYVKKILMAFSSRFHYKKYLKCSINRLQKVACGLRLIVIMIAENNVRQKPSDLCLKVENLIMKTL